MSNDLVQDRDPSTYRKPGPKLTEADRMNVVAHYMTSGSIGLTAEHFDLSRNTVAGLVKTVRDASNSALSTDWRSRMAELPVLCVDAVKDAVTDRTDVYKAAGIAQAHLKGVGIYNADTQVNVTAMLASAPAGIDLDTAIDVTPTPLPVDTGELT